MCVTRAEVKTKDWSRGSQLVDQDPEGGLFSVGVARWKFGGFSLSMLRSGPKSTEVCGLTLYFFRAGTTDGFVMYCIVSLRYDRSLLCHMCRLLAYAWLKRVGSTHGGRCLSSSVHFLWNLRDEVKGFCPPFTHALLESFTDYQLWPMSSFFPV